MTDAAGPLDRMQIRAGQAVMLDRVFACGPQAMLRDASTHLIALTSYWRTPRVALDR